MTARKIIGGAIAAASIGSMGMASTAGADAFPDVIPLPDGYFPEGIEIGDGHTAYVSSLSSGEIAEIDLRTGAFEQLAPGGGGFATIGLDFDARTGLLFAAGGPTGGARVVDTATGAVVASFDLGGGFVNDVIVTRTAAFFTDSFFPVLHRVDLAPDGTPTGTSGTLALDGFTSVAGFNSNGIVATPSGDALVIVNSATGVLYRVDPDSGAAVAIDLGGDDVVAGDGMVLVGRTLYVVQNSLNQIAEVRLSPDLSSGTVVDVIVDDDFDVPATADVFGRSLYAVNARFTTPPGPDVQYAIVRVDR